MGFDAQLPPSCVPWPRGPVPGYPDPSMWCARKRQPQLLDVFRGSEEGKPASFGARYPHARGQGLRQPRLTDIFGERDDWPAARKSSGSTSSTDEMKHVFGLRESFVDNTEQEYFKEVVSYSPPAAGCVAHRSSFGQAPQAIPAHLPSSLARRRGLKLKPVLTPPKPTRRSKAVQRVFESDRIGGVVRG
mmetsp:Transcript_92093/g.269463  ORF Transcript_92093/g.269463 Transcript_92093/m.269463 type:complete len:189 (-) Transcript_92093:453-1019(-)